MPINRFAALKGRTQELESVQSNSLGAVYEIVESCGERSFKTVCIRRFQGKDPFEWGRFIHCCRSNALVDTALNKISVSFHANDLYKAAKANFAKRQNYELHCIHKNRINTELKITGNDDSHQESSRLSLGFYRGNPLRTIEAGTQHERKKYIVHALSLIESCVSHRPGSIR